MYISVYICCLYIFKLIERKTKVKQKKKLACSKLKKTITNFKPQPTIGGLKPRSGIK